jgi:hypothetical protein
MVKKINYPAANFHDHSAQTPAMSAKGWISGSGVPTVAGNPAQNGFHYLNTVQGDIYRKDAGTWGLIGSLHGTEWQFGAGAPADTLGEDRDWYLDTATAEVYKKASGTWTLIGDLIPDGAITTVKLADLAVTDAKLAADAVTTIKILNDAVTNPKLADMAEDAIKGRSNGSGSGDPEDLTPTQVRTIINVEDGSTGDQTDQEIEDAYNNQVPAASQAEVEAGTEAAIRRFSPLRLAQAISELATGGFADVVPITSGSVTYGITGSVTDWAGSNPTGSANFPSTTEVWTSATGNQQQGTFTVTLNATGAAVGSMIFNYRVELRNASNQVLETQNISSVFGSNPANFNIPFNVGEDPSEIVTNFTVQATFAVGGSGTYTVVVSSPTLVNTQFSVGDGSSLAMTAAHNGVLFAVDASTESFTFNTPSIAAEAPYSFGVLRINATEFNRFVNVSRNVGAGDLMDGGAGAVALLYQEEFVWFIADPETTNWQPIVLGAAGGRTMQLGFYNVADGALEIGVGISGTNDNENYRMETDQSDSGGSLLLTNQGTAGRGLILKFDHGLNKWLFGADTDLQDAVLENAELRNYHETVFTVSTPGATPNINLNNGNIQEMVLNANITSWTFSNFHAGSSLTLRLVQDAATPRTVAWTSPNVLWDGGNDHVMTPTVDAIDIVTIFSPDGIVFYGTIGGQDFS